MQGKSIKIFHFSANWNEPNCIKDKELDIILNNNNKNVNNNSITKPIAKIRHADKVAYLLFDIKPAAANK